MTSPSARVLQLAYDMASYIHHSGYPRYDGGHSEPEAQCAHPDCAAVRAALADEDPTLLGNILRRALPHAETRLQILDVAGPDACISKITLSKKLRGASLLTFATENVTPGEVMNPETARFVGVVVWVPRALWPR